MNTLYTFGYLHPREKRDQLIFHHLIIMRIPCIDIRYSATSNDKHYSGEVIKARPGIIYEHIPDLGNTRYFENLNGQFQEPVIEIANMQAGLDALHAIMMQYGKAAIFCACSSVEHCHRKVVAQKAHELFGWQIVHLPVHKRKKKTA
jgi:hypothetical protein